MDQAFTYIKVNNGIDTEKSYRYEAAVCLLFIQIQNIQLYSFQDGKCKFNPANVGATCTGFIDIKSGSEEDLQDAIFNVGPISVAIDASQDSFQFYSEGVYYEGACSSDANDLDHGVTVVGFSFEGTKKPEYYYIVKNSWGEGWGIDGYILMSRNQNNNCGIATMASFPTV